MSLRIKADKINSILIYKSVMHHDTTFRVKYYNFNNIIKLHLKVANSFNVFIFCLYILLSCK